MNSRICLGGGGKKEKYEMWFLDTLTGSVCVMVGMMAVVPTTQKHAFEFF